MSLSHFYELAHCVTAKRSEIGKLRDMGSAAALEKIEQGTGRARQDPVLGEVCLGHQSVAVFEIPKAERNVGVGAEGEIGTEVARRFNDGAAVVLATRTGMAERGVVEFERHSVLRGGLDHGLDVDGEGGIARVAYHVDPAAPDGVDHGLGMGCLIAGGKYRFVEACHYHV